MEGLRQCLKDAKKELANKVSIHPGVKQEAPLEMAELKILEDKLRKFIKKGEVMLKENYTEI